ncbi:hypothetical protein AU378_00150 [Chryseobacterium kwangjuense]|uniref:Uncharacterized protein n=1 Tax=Chryseobacterium kwangjuense TaxID=267125 RepID=A0A135WHI1_9FLAO|nr:hypothetical protein AU378_00150 [Chryseobacterium kwangjuense]
MQKGKFCNWMLFFLISLKQCKLTYYNVVLMKINHNYLVQKKIPDKARDYIDNKKFYIILLDLQLL